MEKVQLVAVAAAVGQAEEQEVVQMDRSLSISSAGFQKGKWLF